MNYMLDTNICIYLIKRKPIQVLERFRQAEISSIYISSITVSELEYGVEKSARKEQNKLALYLFLSPFKIIAYDEHAATYYGKIRTILEKKGQIIGALDLLIAAHALSLDNTLITNNEKEFSRIPELKIANWV